jgi:hypothetical protein
MIGLKKDEKRMVPMDPQKRSSTRQTSSTPHSLSDLSGPRQSFLAATVKM